MLSLYCSGKEGLGNPKVPKYFRGGVEKNEDKAIQYFHTAADMGDDNSKHVLKEIAMKLQKQDIENKDFPTDDHSYDSGDSLPESLKEWKKEVKKILS